MFDLLDGVAPKSRLNSGSNCDGLSYPTAFAAVLALYRRGP